MKIKLIVRLSFVIVLGIIAPKLVLARQTVKRSVISGTVINLKTKQPIESVGISLLKAADSTTVVNSLSNKLGAFSLPGIAPGNYTLKLSFIGFKTARRAVVVLEGRSNVLETIALEEGIVLDAVNVEAEVVAVKVVKDTTEFNTKAFKAAPDATVEDGLKKLPGVEVDKDGNIKANGKDVTKITVDGKEFFGSDPKIATKNLPYDAIAKVKIIEDKSEQTKATGIDDGVRVRTMDLVLKEDKKKGWFGNGSGTGGTRDRYMGSASINRFVKDRQFNVLGLSNNINQTGFTTEEATNFGGGGASSSSISSDGGVVSRTVNGVNVGGSSQGLTSTHSGGVNFSDVWGKKKSTKFSGSYFGTGSSTFLLREQNTQLTQVNGNFFNHNNNTNNNTSQSHRFNSRFNPAIDSLNSFSISPSFTLGISRSLSSGVFSQADADNNFINSGQSQTNNHNVRPSLSGSSSFTHRLHNKKGTASLYISGNLNPSATNYINQSENNFYQAGKPAILINRLEDRDQLSSSLDASINYNRTLKRMSADGKKGTGISTSLSPTLNISLNNNNRNTLEFDPVSGLYDARLDSLTNESKSKTTRIGGAAGISVTKSKWNFNIRGNLSNINLEGHITDSKNGETVNRNYLSLTPNLSFVYNLKPSRSLSFYFSGYNYTPSLGNLVLNQNNTSPLYISIGNPDLKITHSYNSNLYYSSSNVQHKTYSNIYLTYYTSQNEVSRNTFFDDKTGITTSKPVNVSGNYQVDFYGSFSIPSKIPGLRINPGFTFYGTHSVNFINGVKNNSDQLNSGGSLSVNYAYKDALSLSLSNRSNYTHLANSVKTTLNNHYLNLDNSFTINGEVVKKWRLLADFAHRRQSNQSFVLLNAGIQHYLMQNNKLLVEFRGFDLLNRNIDFQKYSYDNQIVDTRTNNIRQYFYLKLTYKVNKIGTKTVAPPASGSVKK